MNRVENLLLDYGYDGVVYFTNPSYERAFLGVSTDDRAIYDFDLMVESLMEEEGMTEEDAAEWIDYNCSYYFDGCPIIMHRLEE